MTIDFDALLYQPLAEVFGVEAMLAPEFSPPVTVTVRDRTRGVKIEAGEESGFETIVPAAVVRMAELAAAGLTRADVRGAALTFNGVEWRVEASEPMPSPTGEATGELLLQLIRITE